MNKYWPISSIVTTLTFFRCIFCEENINTIREERLWFWFFKIRVDIKPYRYVDPNNPQPDISVTVTLTETETERTYL
jgi:hypothetical protein